MPIQSYHSSSGGGNFLGLRTGPSGRTEIVYDDGASRRLVWAVAPGANPVQIGDALQSAVEQPRVVPALYAELKKRSIDIEAIAGGQA